MKHCDPPWMKHSGDPTSTENATARPGPRRAGSVQSDAERLWNSGWLAGWKAGWQFCSEEWLWQIKHATAHGHWGQAPPLFHSINSGGGFAGTSDQDAAAAVAWWKQQLMHQFSQQLQRDTAWWEEQHGGERGGYGRAGGLQ